MGARRETSLNALVFSLRFQLFGIIVRFELFKILKLSFWLVNIYFALIAMKNAHIYEQANKIDDLTNDGEETCWELNEKR